MLDKSKVDTELARRFCAAALAEKLAREGQDVFYDKLGALATTLIPDEILTQLTGWISKLPVHGAGDCVFPSAKLVTPSGPRAC
jgi:hypothetical protein